MNNARRFLQTIHRDNGAQDAFEYLLMGGTVVIVLYLALLGLKELIPAVVGIACPVIDAATGSNVAGACITP